MRPIHVLKLSPTTQRHMKSQIDQTGIVAQSMDHMIDSVQQVVASIEYAEQAIINIDQSAHNNQTAMGKNVQMTPVKLQRTVFK